MMRRYGRLIIRPFRGRYSRKILYDLSKKIIENLQLGNHIATGRMLRNIHITGMGVEIDVPYAIYLDTGGRPHFPPIRPLVEWAKAKFGLNRSEAYRIAWVIRQKIAFRGTKPTFFIRHALADLGFEIVDRWYEGAYTVIYIRRAKKRGLHR